MVRRIALVTLLLSAFHVGSAHADSYLLAFDERPLRLLDLRLTMGKVSESSHYADTGFIADPAIVGRIGLEGRPGDWNMALLPEIGGSFWSTEQTGGALFTAGLGVGWTKGPWLFGVVPSLVTGTYQRGDFESDARGVRLTTTLELMQIGGVQATYQRLLVDGRTADQTMVSASMNLIPLYILARICGSR